MYVSSLKPGCVRRIGLTGQLDRHQSQNYLKPCTGVLTKLCHKKCTKVLFRWQKKLPSMCPQFNSMKQTLGIYKQRRDKLGSTTVPTLGRRSQSAIRFNPHTLQTWLCADIVQFWPLSLCHATPRERVQGQQFAHVSSRGVAFHRERGQNCADHVLHTVRELKQRRGRKQWKRH